MIELPLPLRPVFKFPVMLRSVSRIATSGRARGEVVLNCHRGIRVLWQYIQFCSRSAQNGVIEMKRLILAMTMLAALGACGADGEPVEPTANVGISVSNSGVHTGASVGVRKGPVSINWNVFN